MIELIAIASKFKISPATIITGIDRKQKNLMSRR